MALEEQSILCVSSRGAPLFNCDCLQKWVSKCSFELVGLKAFRQTLRIDGLSGGSSRVGSISVLRPLFLL